MKRFLYLMLGLTLALAIGCNNGTKPEVADKPMTFEKEMELLASEHDLNAMMVRSSEGIVDWQLSREFAQLVLDEFIANEEFPADCELWDIPIAIYDGDGMVRYYEFRVMHKGKVIAAIAGNAREDLGGPISRVFEMDGYADELATLYESGTLSENDIPRIVDNDYPSYAVASVAVTRSGDIDFTTVLNPETGTEESELTKVLTVKEMIEKNPEVFAEVNLEAVDATVNEYSEQIEQLWTMAKANKGSLGNLVFRGSKKKPRTEVDSARLEKASRYGWSKANSYGSLTKPVSYGACGATAAGFLLDFIHANKLGSVGDWETLKNTKERKDALNDKMNITSNGITWPHNLGNAVKDYTDYKVTLALGVVPNTSIENNLPGINLRGLDMSSRESIKGGMHYRNVIAYREDGWGIFKWSSIKILDGNNVDGGWETYNPFYHLFSYNLVRE